MFLIRKQRNAQLMQLHVFSFTAEEGYGPVIYARYSYDNPVLLAANISIPRMERRGAIVGPLLQIFIICILYVNETNQVVV